MPLALSQKPDTDPDVDNDLNPGHKAARELFDKDNNQGEKSNDISNKLNDSSLLNREKQDGLYDGSGTSGASLLTSPKGGLKNALLKGINRKRFGATAAISGIFISLIGIFLSILPLKLDAFISTITEQVSSIAQYPIEERFEYVVTRWIAMRAMKEAYPGDENLVFCRGGGILCHLGSTKYNQWFEKKLDTEFEASGRNVRVKLNSKGRTSLGGKATSFTLNLESKDPNSAIKGVEKELNHKQARRHINNMVKEIHPKSYFMRMLSKRMLYRKYGIKRFSIPAFDKKLEKYRDRKSNIKTNMNKRIAAKMGPRLPMYLSCILGTNLEQCRKDLDALSNDVDQRIADAEKEGGQDSDKYKKAKGQKDFLDHMDNAIKTGDGVIGKIISKQVVKKLLVGSAIIGAIDMVASLVEAIDNKVIETVGADQISQLYTAFTYDEEISPMLVRDQMRAGDLDSNDRIRLATSMFDGAESSPLYQSTFGSRASASSLLYPVTYAADGGVRTKCEVGGEQKVVTLAPGELVCPEKKIVQDYTAFTKYSAWKVMAGIAEVWNSSIGAFIEFVGDVVSKAFSWLFDKIKDFPPIKAISDFSEAMVEKVVSWAISLIFRMPEVGIDAPGNNNYEALHGGITTTVHASTEAGREEGDDKHTTSGIGGQRLSNEQLGALYDEVEARRDEDFRDQPLMAKLFDTTQSRSVASQLLAIMPMSSVSTLQLLTRMPTAVTSAFMPKPSYAAGSSRAAALRAFGVIWHGYPDKEVLHADPTQYTEEVCEKYRKERQLKFDKTVPSYDKADPCALEVSVAAAIANAADDKENPYYPKEIDETGAGGSAGSVNVDDSELLDEAQKFGDRMAWGGHGNGEIPQSALREMNTAPGHYLHPKASEAFDAMNQAYADSNGGQYLVINESYRTLSTQQSYYNSGDTAAPPGTSNHGTGLAVDINVGGFDSNAYKWLAENAAKYGFVNPRWARDRSDNRWYKDEPWHWEYARRVE